MKQKSLPFAMSVLIATGMYSSLVSAQNTAIELSQKFESIHAPVNLEAEVPASYFVRVAMDPVVVWEKKQKDAGVIVTQDARKTYIANVKVKLQQVVEAFESEGYEALSPVVATDVGFSIVANKAQVQALSKKIQVDNIVPKHLSKKQRAFSTQWIGGERAHQEYGLKGKGQTIAIIDTGIDYLHADFLGSGDPTEFATNDPTIIEPGSFPTATVIGGYDFAGFDYDASDVDNATPAPDADPLDDGRHGTHVAGIAAGRAIGTEMAAGIAPEASLYALKVFGANGSTNLTSQAIEKAMDPNGDGDSSDAVDVINMSLGSIFGSPSNSTSVSAENAVTAGTVVVASAGNSGNDIPYISGSPGAAEGVIAVASSISGGVGAFFVLLDTPEGGTYDFFAKYATISPPLGSVIEAPLHVSEPFDACTPVVNDFAGDVAFITRGGCAFTTKLSNALQAGASAALVMNNVPGPAIPMGGSDVELPGAMITQAEGQLLLDILQSTAIAAEFAPTNTRLDPSDDDTISDFSSRGPGPTGLFKPDVTAPGDEIESAQSGSGTGALTLSGTSMAAPQVAGMAALLKEKFPELEPMAIKAIIQNTARPAKILGEVGTPPLSLQGTGIVDIEKALNSTSYAAPGGLGFGVFRPEYNDATTRYIEVTNFSDTDQRFVARIEENMGAGSKGVVVDVLQELYVGAGQTERVPVTMRIQASDVEATTNFQEFDGWIVFESAMSELRVGYMAVVEPASRIDVHRQQDIYSFRNTAFGSAEIFGYTASASPQSNLGFASISPETAEFVVNADADWDQFSKYVLEMSIDVDEDGIADFLASVGDLNSLDPLGFDQVTGTIASAIDNVQTTTRNLLYLANARNNNSVVQFQLDLYGPFGFLPEGDTTFDYELTLTNLYSDRATAVQIGAGSIDLATQVSFDTRAIFLPTQVGTTITVGGEGQPMFVVPTESVSEKRVK